MQLSLDRPVLAGAVAVLGAAAVVGNPVDRTVDVTLAAVDNPVQQLILSAGQAQSYLFATYFNGGDAPTPGAGEANWPSAGFDQTGGDALNYALYNQISLGNYSAVGLLPQAVTDDFPAAGQWALNVFDYSNVMLNGLGGAALALNNGVWDFPSAAYSAVQLAFNGQIGEALTALVDAIVIPVTDAIAAVRAAGDYVVSRVAARAVAVAAEVANFVTALAGSIGGGVQLLADQTAAIVGEVVTQLGAGQFQNAWTAAVDGLFGPSGLPGTVLNMTIGAGIQTGPIIDPATDIATNFVPSIRTVLQAGSWTLRNALTTQPAPTASVRAASARPTAARVDAPRTAVRAPAAAAARPASVKPDGVRRAPLGRGH